MPGYPYEGNDPDGFMPRDAIAGRIAGYAAAIGAPVELGTSVDRLSAADHSGFLLETSGGPLAARRVVVAAGPFHRPKVPSMAAADRFESGMDSAVTGEPEQREHEGLVVGHGHCPLHRSPAPRYPRERHPSLATALLQIRWI
jgi:putative flavoprotein involved in K+ transport